MAAKAFITGITGQDGSYLADLLLQKGYEVHGLVRNADALGHSRIRHLTNDPALRGHRLFVHAADLNDPASLRRVLKEVAPTEIYHLAGQTHVGLSFEIPEATCQITAMATVRLLDIIRDLRPLPRFYYASSSEVFGQPSQFPQDEATPFAPVNPYGCAKAFATWMVGVYRRSYGLFACNGIAYNHESPRRGENFVTRKICRAAAAIKLGLQEELHLGDLSAKRDWGDARDFVRAMWLALQHPIPEDYVLATGRLHSVEEVVATAFAVVQLDWRTCVKQDRALLRPTEPTCLAGNAAKAKRLLNWEPQISFERMIEEMVKADLAALDPKKAHCQGP
jgi:GDPmannose 4,6-dehydratase